MREAPTHHLPGDARAEEAAYHGTKPHVFGKPPVAKGYAVAIHGGQHHVGEDGTFNAGISRTKSAAALQGGKLPTDPPTIGKRLPTPAVSWGQKSVGAEKHDASGAQAKKILNEAYAASGVDHPANFGRLPSTVTEET